MACANALSWASLTISPTVAAKKTLNAFNNPNPAHARLSKAGHKYKGHGSKSTINVVAYLKLGLARCLARPWHTVSKRPTSTAPILRLNHICSIY